jgi:predicted Zn-dependent protease
MGVFALLTGAALGARGGEGAAVSRPSRAAPAVALTIGLLLWLAAALGVVVPVGIAESRAQRGDDMIRTRQARSASGQFRSAFESLWIPNADYAYRAALALAPVPGAARESRALLDAAIATDPINVTYYRTRAQFELAQPAPDPARVTADFDRATRLDPNDVSTHLDYAEALVRLGLGQKAIEEYRTALAFNDLLDPAEPKRLSQAKIEQIRQRIRTLEG